MASIVKNQRNILDKLKIEKLNSMQKEAQLAIHSAPDVVLLSPTGTGKTLAFLLPIIQDLDPRCSEIQVLILVPSRELAIQIEQVTREMGTGYKTNAVYGGRSGSQDKIDLKHRPAILIGTPGRIADRIRRDSFSCEFIHVLVLDEFDKSLEIGFEAEMKEIAAALPRVKKRILTSATQHVEIPGFVGLKKPIIIDHLSDGVEKLKVKSIISPNRDKLKTLVRSLSFLGNQPGIVFCNFKDSIHRVSEFLTENKIPHGCFFGGMEQLDRERALIKFRNGTHQLIIATDLAARGIDVPEIKFIIHYHLPLKAHEFTHRNGRTARMHNEGAAYVLQWKDEVLPEFIEELNLKEQIIKDYPLPHPPKWKTLHISGGRRDKISKGDIAGLFLKQGDLNKDELGVIELKADSSYVAVPSYKVNSIIELLNNNRLKKKKVRVSLI